MRITKHSALVALTALAFAAGCGDDDEDAATTTPDSAADTAAETSTAPTERTEAETTADEPPARGDDTGTEPVGDADVTLTDFEVDLAKTSFPREGVYTVNVVNDGDTRHALAAEGPNGETETEEIAPGESAQLDAYFVSGTYKLYCPIGDHEQRGMTAQLRVNP